MRPTLAAVTALPLLSRLRSPPYGAELPVAQIEGRTSARLNKLVGTDKQQIRRARIAPARQRIGPEEGHNVFVVIELAFLISTSSPCWCTFYGSGWEFVELILAARTAAPRAFSCVVRFFPKMHGRDPPRRAGFARPSSAPAMMIVATRPTTQDLAEFRFVFGSRLLKLPMRHPRRGSSLISCSAPTLREPRLQKSRMLQAGSWIVRRPSCPGASDAGRIGRDFQTNTEERLAALPSEAARRSLSPLDALFPGHPGIPTDRDRYQPL